MRSCKADNQISTHSGVTNPVPLSDTSGVVYTFSFRRNLAGSNPTVGAGVGTVSVTNGVPVRSQSIRSHRLQRTDKNESHARASASKISAIITNESSTNMTQSYWWDAATEPYYGVNSAWLDSQGSYIYAMGPANTTSAGGDWQYMTRVPVQEATTLSSYEYVLVHQNMFVARLQISDERF